MFPNFYPAKAGKSVIFYGAKPLTSPTSPLPFLQGEKSGEVDKQIYVFD
jgi:hypothetical protein